MNPQASPRTGPAGGDVERQLIDRARTGDMEAFASLYNARQAEVYRFVLNRVHQRPLAEDITQETFLRAMARLDTFAWRGEASLIAWLVTIARNKIADHYKSSRVQREMPVGDTWDTAAVDRSAEESALGALAAVEHRQVLLAAFVLLPDSHRRVVELRYLRELSVTETARVLARSEGAVKTLSHRALHSLRQAVAA